VSLAKQWQEELDRMSVKGSLRSILWYGNERGDLDTLLDPESTSKVDVVITTYGTLSSEHLKWTKNKDKLSYEGGSLFDGEYAMPRQVAIPA
jgi:DNA repair protein RAD5